MSGPKPAARPLRLVDLAAQYHDLKGEIDRRMAAVLAHGAFVSGPEVGELEAALAAQAGLPHAVTVASGTDALQIALMAADVGPGDAVFVPAFTFVATAGAVRLAGAEPVFVDVDAQTCNMDPADLGRRIDRVARGGRLRPRAVVPVDLYGLPADHAGIAAEAGRAGLFVLADAAQSFGAIVGNRPASSLAPATATSFFPTKPLGCFGDGGALFAAEADFAARCRSIRTHGFGEVRGNAERVGLTGRLDTLQAAILLAKLPRLEAELRRRDAVARIYDTRLAGACRLPARPQDRTSAWALYTIRTPRRDAVAEVLRAADVECGVYYPVPLHRQTAYRRFDAGGTDLPVSEELSRTVLSLPVHPYLSDDDANRVADLVLDALSRTS